jgi:hypothetical protein
MDIWKAVQVVNADHARTGEAGTVFAYNREKHPDSVAVKFDTDGTVEVVLIADLKAL